MATTTTIEVFADGRSEVQPYVEQLFDDSDVQKQLSRAAANLRGARSRAGSAKSKKKALKDQRLRQRLLESGRGGRRRRCRRSSRGRRSARAAGAGAGCW